MRGGGESCWHLAWRELRRRCRVRRQAASMAEWLRWRTRSPLGSGRVGGLKSFRCRCTSARGTDSFSPMARIICLTSPGPRLQRPRGVTVCAASDASAPLFSARALLATRWQAQAWSAWWEGVWQRMLLVSDLARAAQVCLTADSVTEWLR